MSKAWGVIMWIALAVALSSAADMRGEVEPPVSLFVIPKVELRKEEVSQGAPP